MVIVFPVYKISVALNVFITLTKLRTAPEIKPGIISGTVVLKKVFIGGTPKLIDASSTDASIWYKMPILERIAYGSFLITKEIMIIHIEPVSNIGSRLNATVKQIPNTAPGITYGNISSISIKSERKLFRLTIKYAPSKLSKIIINKAINAITKVFIMEFSSLFITAR